MNKSPAHWLYRWGRECLVIYGATMFLFSSFLASVNHLLVAGTMVFAVASAPSMGLGLTEKAGSEVIALRSAHTRGLTDDDDDDDGEDDDDKKKKTPTPNGDDDVAPTPVAEPTQPATQIINTPTQSLPSERPKRQPATATSLPLRHGIIVRTPAPSQTSSAASTSTATATPAAIDTPTEMVLSSPTPTSNIGVIRHLIPEAPIVRKLLRFQFPLSIFLALLLGYFIALWRKQ
jgi:hypothetical protein